MMYVSSINVPPIPGHIRFATSANILTSGLSNPLASINLSVMNDIGSPS